MKKVLVIGASGFVGKHVARRLQAEGYHVRCLARNIARLQDLDDSQYELVQGDISDLDSMERVFESVDAAYICIHTLTPQQGRAASQRFMEVEQNGLQNIVTACRKHGVRRLVYLTSLGITPNAKSEWMRDRWQVEQFLLRSGLDVTIIRPGMIVGAGGTGFNMMINQANRRVAVLMGKPSKSDYIAIDDLTYYLTGVLEDSRTFGQCYEVGGDAKYTSDEMIDIIASIQGRKPPIKLHIPQSLLYACYPLVERFGKYPKGAFKGIVQSLQIQMTGNPLPLRAILSRLPMTYHQAVERSLTRK